MCDFKGDSGNSQVLLPVPMEGGCTLPLHPDTFLQEFWLVHLSGAMFAQSLALAVLLAAALVWPAGEWVQ